MDQVEWRETVGDLRKQWKQMWRERIDDEVRAEGIANQEFPHLFVEQGHVIIATRDYKAPDFEEILEKHRSKAKKSHGLPPHPLHGGYGKFIKDVIVKQTRYSSKNQRRRSDFKENDKKSQPLKNGGRGWLNYAR